MSTDSQSLKNAVVSEYEEPALDAYESIKDFFREKAKKPGEKAEGNFWQLGCTFDSVLDYLRFVQKSDSEFIADALKIYNDLKSEPVACWYDDFGWWGIAAAKAYDPSYAEVFGAKSEDFKTVASECWATMYKGKDDELHFGGPNVWENRCLGEPDRDYFNNPQKPEHWAVPRFEKGVWQYDMFTIKRKDEKEDGKPCECGGSNPSNPTEKGNLREGIREVTLGPFQNTVMNGLYWVLALRLFNKDASVTSQVIQDEYDFLSNWFFLPNEPDNALLDVFLLQDGIHAALVRERVSTYAWCETTQSYPPVNCYHKDAFWSGDQGLMMAALIDYGGLKGDPKALEIAQNILRGVAAKLTHPDKVLKAYGYPWPAQDDDDYCSGIGVFLRYLLYANQRNAGIASLVQEEAFQKIIRATADYYIAPPYLHSPKFIDQNLFKHFNRLASLTTAMSLLVPTE